MPGQKKLRLRQAVLVEGRYDKVRLEAVLDALILPVGGFAVFSDRELRGFIRTLAEQRGIVILTDSDRAGFQIRHFIRGLVKENQVTDVYIPDVFGKEKRKKSPSKEGKLGVEGIDAATLMEAFRRAGIAGEEALPRQEITRADLYEDGFFGGENSRELRWALYDRLGLPRRLNVTAALSLLGRMLTREEYKALAAEPRNGSRQ